MKRTSYGKISFKALLNYKNANIAPFLLGLFYLLFPWFNTGVLDETTAIFGLMFLTVAVMRAKPKNSVISGLCQAFIAVSYIFALTGVMGVNILWTLTIALAVIFFVFELGFVKFGPVTTRADVFQIVPLTILAFGLIMSFAGYASLYVIDFTNMFEALNYLCVMIFSLTFVFQLAGWSIMGKNTNKLLLVLGLVVVASALIGAYSGTLWMWS